MPSFCLEMILAFTCIAIFYAIMIMAFAYYWRDDSELPKTGSKKLVSVIVAFRNEEENLKTLIDSLLSQSHKNCEFIFINDGSDDNFEEIFAQYSDSRIICKTLNAGKSGKKAALKYGSEISRGEILYFTDADCKLQPDCIRIMLSEMQEQGIAMLCGPVCFAKRKGFLNKIFRLEFLSLTGSGAAGFFMNRPFMCNGANFMVERKVYAEADLNEKYSSGDDVFLLHHAEKNHKVGFAQHTDCIVETQAPKTLGDFVSQRVRWASKSGGYKNPFAILVAATTFAMSLVLLATFVMACLEPIYFLVYLCLFFIKLAVDVYFLVPVLGFYGQKRLGWLIAPLNFFYPIYIVGVAMVAVFYKPRWKGRKIQ